MAEEIYICKYCNKSFKRMNTLSVHLCPKKKRYQQQNDVGVQLGFRSYLDFYNSTQGNTKPKTYDDFVDSSYYSAFVKYGRYLVDIRVINSSSFTEWLLKNNKKLDHWTKEIFYGQWLSEYLRRENVKDALERSLKEMQRYADSNEQLNGNFTLYFRLGNKNKICQDIVNGRISAWVVYNCPSGVEFLDSLNQEQLAMILPFVQPEFWQKKLKEYTEEKDWIKEILLESGL